MVSESGKDVASSSSLGSSLGAHTDHGCTHAPTKWVICVGAVCTDSLVYQAPTGWVICAGTKGIFYLFSGDNGYCLGFGGVLCVFGDRCVLLCWGLFWGFGSGVCFGVRDLIGFLGFGT